MPDAGYGLGDTALVRGRPVATLSGVYLTFAHAERVLAGLSPPNTLSGRCQPIGLAWNTSQRRGSPTARAASQRSRAALRAGLNWSRPGRRGLIRTLSESRSRPAAARKVSPLVTRSVGPPTGAAERHWTLFCCLPSPCARYSRRHSRRLHWRTGSFRWPAVEPGVLGGCGCSRIFPVLNHLGTNARA